MLFNTLLVDESVLISNHDKGRRVAVAFQAEVRLLDESGRPFLRFDDFDLVLHDFRLHVVVVPRLEAFVVNHLHALELGVAVLVVFLEEHVQQILGRRLRVQVFRQFPTPHLEGLLYAS